MWFNKYKDKFFLVLMRKEEKLYHVVRVFEIKTLSETIKVDKLHSYHVDFKFPTYINQNKRFYFLEYDKGDIIATNVIQSVISSEELDLLLSNHVIRDIASGVLDDKKDKIIMFCFGAAIGGLLGWLIAQSIMQGKIDELKNNTTIVPLTSILQIIWRFFHV